MKKHILIGLIIVILDQIIKYLMINNTITIINNFLNLIYTQNIGAAFGIGSRIFVTIASLIIFIIILLFMILDKNRKKRAIPYMLIISGTISNLIDRIYRGYVIDYIQINIFNFPVFNIADICIVIGVLILIKDIIFIKEENI